MPGEDSTGTTQEAAGMGGNRGCNQNCTGQYNRSLMINQDKGTRLTWESYLEERKLQLPTTQAACLYGAC